eukprot:scaffold7571_cov403-Prasinococcus_capsulatus_cf.AAC.4
MLGTAARLKVVRTYRIGDDGIDHHVWKRCRSGISRKPLHEHDEDATVATWCTAATILAIRAGMRSWRQRRRLRRQRRSRSSYVGLPASARSGLRQAGDLWVARDVGSIFDSLGIRLQVPKLPGA